MFQSRLYLFLLLLFIVSCKNEKKAKPAGAGKLIRNEPTTQQIKTEDSPSKFSVNKKKGIVTITKEKEIVGADNSLLIDKTAQSFRIDQGRDTILYCAEGTMIKISKQSFIFEDSNSEPQQVTINIKEYYKIDDIIFDDLSTRSGDSILETGGMIFIEALSDKKKCKLKRNASFEISFPSDIRKEGMQLFSGNWRNGAIDWAAEAMDSSLYLAITSMAQFPGGNDAYLKFWDRNLEYPDSLSGLGNFRMVIRFNIDPTGKIKNPIITNSPHKFFDQLVLKIFSKMPKWEPEIRKDIPVESLFTQSIYFYSVFSEEKLTFDSTYRSNFEANMSDTSINEGHPSEIREYIFSCSKLGWINCDRFYKTGNPKNDFFVKTGSYSDADVKMIFHSFKGILDSDKDTRGYVFKSIPSGEKITILAIAKQKGKNFIAVTESTTGSSIKELVFEQVTIEGLKQKVAQLNDR